MDVEVSFDVVESYQLGQTVRLGSFDFPSILSQLGCDKVHPQCFIDALLSLSRNPLLSLEETVLVQLPVLGLGDPPQTDVVVLGPGEVLQRGTEALGVNDTEVRLQLDKSCLHNHARLRGPAHDDLFNTRECGKRFHHLLWFVRGHQNVEVTHRFPHPPSRARHGYPANVALCLQHFDQLFSKRETQSQECPLPRSGEGAETVEYVLLALLAKPSELPDSALPGGLLKFLDARHSELLVQGLHSLRANARDVKELQKTWREFGLEPLQVSYLPGLDIFLDLLGECLPDSREL